MIERKASRISSAVRRALFVTSAGAIGQAFPAGAALAQCNSNSNPAPPTALVFNLSNLTFGNPPRTPFATQGFVGLDGCQGQTGSSQNDGLPGLPGQAGAQITSTSTNVTVVGGQAQGGAPFAPTSGAFIGNVGGSGGTGGQSGPPITTPTSGGQGGQGGTSGSVTVTFDGSFVADPSSGVAGVALTAQSIGGDGGTGGGTNTSFAGGKFGGDGGAAGAGGDVSLAASGGIAAFTIAASAASQGGLGGAGGVGDSNFDRLSEATGGDGGQGGAGGGASIRWNGGNVQSGFIGLTAISQGGTGGAGGFGQNAAGVQGGNAGAGGNGGAASAVLAAGTILVSPSTQGPGFAIGAQSIGGAGGIGGQAIDNAPIGEYGGSGGAGGNGGSASVTVLGAISFSGAGVTGQADGQAALVQSNGGPGGAGANGGAIVGAGGGGGVAGAGGSAGLTLGNASTRASITTMGNFAHGALVQSVGGSGGQGGNANFVFGGGFAGAGQSGGDGGQVAVTAPNASVLLSGPNGIALLAQSIGGGGGAGGDASDISILVGYAIGGNGGLGGDGSSVDVSLGQGGVFGSTTTLGGGGVLAQSIGGAGGSGGSATSTGVGVFAYVVGGDSEGGGSSGNVTVTSASLIATYGDHAAGIQAQSIGGGGGKGGSGISGIAGIVPTAAVSIGGRGGGGGAAGEVMVTNTAQISTYGADAPGVLLQSVGGGGGSGGSAAARAVDLSPDKDIPAISVSVATGGQGGAGNTGGTVTLGNSGLITTAGDAAFGVMAQSIGGGGGAGGDATAASYSGGNNQGGLSISVDVAVGGAGGSGATGGQVTLNNAGLIATLGQDAFGVFAQSVGGGGGTGGGGDATASSNDAKGSFAVSLAVGGKGGDGGVAGVVQLTNTGAVTTRGDGADGVFAQSVGGGGGAAGGGVATANGGNLAAAVGVGGNGGTGGDGNTATVSNSGSIVTRGTDAIGLSVQSIGGGGGRAGKGGATAGGVSTLSNAQNLFDILGQGLNFNQQVTTVADGILQIGQIGENIEATLDELAGIFEQPQAGDDEIGEATQIDVSVSVGGSGGAAGRGGAVNATNTGAISTFGAQSDAVYAQSVGGGGGSGGAATSTTAASDDTPVQSAIAVGGAGGGGGDGGAVTVVNGTGGTILTQGVAAVGIYAQSIGGGGGEGSMAGAVSGSLRSLSVGVGGNGGTGGDGGTVSVTTGDGTSGSSVTTTGKHGIAILAQSVGGGGGVVRTMTTDQTFDPSKIINNPQGRIGDLQGLAVTLGGQNGIGGDGGQVGVTVSGPVTTSGLLAHGTVAQSVGGGGGLVIGGRVNLQSPAAAGGATGDGGPVTVQLLGGAALSTAGHGAYGILAQSVGGGGGIAGDLSGLGDPPVIASWTTDTSHTVRPNDGNGGAVAVSVTSAQVQTTGNHAPAIFAQSIGGGGGLIGVDASGSATLSRGTAGGTGSGGAVSVSLVNSRVFAQGVGSGGIVAQSAGTGAGQIRISIDQNSHVRGGTADPNGSSSNDAAAIRLLGGTNNVITNAGTIEALSGGLAILADGTAANTAVTNHGTLIGGVSFEGSINSVSNLAGGVIDAGSTFALGGAGSVLRNAGTIFVGGAGSAGQTTLTGDLDHQATGRLVVDTDHAAGATDLLFVQGRASLSGAVEVRPITLANRPVTLLSATNGLSVESTAVSLRSSHLFRYDLQHAGSELRVQPVAEFIAATTGFDERQRRVAAHLQEIWDSGTAFDAGFTALARFGDAQGSATALDSLSRHTAGAIAAFRRSVSDDFAVGMLEGCGPGGDPRSAAQRNAGAGGGCAWGRVYGSHARQDTSSDALGYKVKAWNVQAGGEQQLAPGWFAGGTLGYVSSRFRDDATSSDGDTLLVGALVRRQIGPWQVAGAVDAGYGWYDSHRSVPGGMAKASPDVWHVGAHLRAAYEAPAGDGWWLQPRVDLHVSYIRSDGFTETGADPFNLTIGSSRTTTFAAVPAIEVGKSFALESGAMLRPFASAGVKLTAGDDWKATARFAAAPVGQGFDVSTPIPDVLGRFTLGAEVLGTSRWDFRLQYTLESGDGYTSHGGALKIGYRF